MDKLFSIVLGTPEHGWLPVDFHYNDFHLDFAASDVLKQFSSQTYEENHWSYNLDKNKISSL